jgi:hypothetical protein
MEFIYVFIEIFSYFIRHAFWAAVKIFGTLYITVSYIIVIYIPMRLFRIVKSKTWVKTQKISCNKIYNGSSLTMHGYKEEIQKLKGEYVRG